MVSWMGGVNGRCEWEVCMGVHEGRVRAEAVKGGAMGWARISDKYRYIKIQS